MSIQGFNRARSLHQLLETFCIMLGYVYIYHVGTPYLACLYGSSKCRRTANCHMLVCRSSSRLTTPQ